MSDMLFTVLMLGFAVVAALVITELSGVGPDHRRIMRKFDLQDARRDLKALDVHAPYERLQLRDQDDINWLGIHLASLNPEGPALERARVIIQSLGAPQVN